MELKLALIPAGEFLMGSAADERYRRFDEVPQHKVRITKPFYMGTTEVTQAEWKAVMGSEPWLREEGRARSTDGPANSLSWDDAAEFCRVASQKTGRTVRLPTEAEWEYACRAGETTAYSFGDRSANLSAYAWFGDNAREVGEGDAHPVGMKKPNAWALYDMHGNVEEWCSDWYGKDYYGQSPTDDPTGPPTSKERVLRGGHWYNDSIRCRSAVRGSAYPTKPRASGGFRVLLEIVE